MHWHTLAKTTQSNNWHTLWKEACACVRVWMCTWVCACMGECAYVYAGTFAQHSHTSGKMSKREAEMGAEMATQDGT